MVGIVDETCPAPIIHPCRLRPRQHCCALQQQTAISSLMSLRGGVQTLHRMCESDGIVCSMFFRPPRNDSSGVTTSSE